MRPERSAARRWCRWAATVVLAAAPLGAQSTSGTVIVNGPQGNPITDGTPLFNISTVGFQASELPLQITLQIAVRSDFGGALLADTTVTGTAAAIVIPRLLPQSIQIWWRARVRTAQGALSISDAVGPRTTMPWLTLIQPNERNGSVLDSNQPTFLWASPAVHAPVTPWQYFIRIIYTATGLVANSGPPSETNFVPSPALEANTSYRWDVTAYLPFTGDSIHVNSFGTFVILDPNAPRATVLYHNFPNPFPTPTLAKTCIWFDLRRTSEVQLEVLDIRGNHVARILPGRGLSGPIAPGQYGRATVGSSSGCDDRLTWDGTDDRGKFVPPGVYIVRFRGDGKTSQFPLLWKGH